ncbi:MAG: carbohydrate ABC transporter permease [Chloroflexota bacterium]
MTSQLDHSPLGQNTTAVTSWRASKSRQKFIGNIVIYITLFVGALVLMIPLFWMMSTSVKPQDQIYTYPIVWIPREIVWENYPAVFEDIAFGRFLWNSTVISFFGIIGNLVGSSLAAYGFARFRFPGRTILFVILLSTMMVPLWVTMIPTFIIFKELGWLNTYLPLIVPHFFAQPFYTFLLRQFFLGIPREMDEAARIDGASSIRIFWQIYLPLSNAALITVAIFSFFYHWNELLMPLIYLQSQDKFPVALGIASFVSDQTQNFALMMAAALIAMAPLLILFFFAQRLFMQGVVMTGVKG